MTIDKRMKYEMQGGVRNYLGNQKEVKAPLNWQSGPDHPSTELAYITQKEKDLLLKKDLHKSLKGGVNRGPSGIISLNGWGSTDPGQNVSGAAASAAESGRHTSDTLAAGMSNKDVQDFRSAAIASGAGQTVNPGWFGPRNRVSKDELAAAKAFAPQAYRGTRGRFGGLGGLLRGALGIFGGLPGQLLSGILGAKNWAKNKGQAFGEGIEEFGNYPTLDRYLNRKTDKYKDKPYLGQGKSNYSFDGPTLGNDLGLAINRQTAPIGPGLRVGQDLRGRLNNLSPASEYEGMWDGRNNLQNNMAQDYGLYEAPAPASEYEGMWDGPAVTETDPYAGIEDHYADVSKGQLNMLKNLGVYSPGKVSPYGINEAQELVPGTDSITNDEWNEILQGTFQAANGGLATLFTRRG